MVKNTQSSSCLSQDAIVAQLASIAARLDAIILPLKDDIAALKTVMCGTPFRIDSQKGNDEFSPNSVDFRSNQGPRSGIQSPLTDPVTTSAISPSTMLHPSQIIGDDSLKPQPTLDHQAPSQQFTSHQLVTPPKPILLHLSKAEKQVPYPYEGAAFWSPSDAHEDEKQWLHKRLLDQPMTVHSSYGGDYKVWISDHEKVAVHRWKQKKNQVSVTFREFIIDRSPSFISFRLEDKSSLWTGSIGTNGSGWVGSGP